MVIVDRLKSARTEIDRAVAWRAPIALSCGTLLLASCAHEVDAHAKSLEVLAARRAILITCDTLRADHLGCYGYERPTSPRIDQLAEESLVFDNDWSAAPLTLPSISALLAGRPPDEIGAASCSNTLLMPSSVTTLAELARAAGLVTAAVVSSSVFERVTPEQGDVGVQQGFEYYDDSLSAPFEHRNLRERNAKECTDAVLRWLDGREGDDDRFFLWVHYQDPHGPYLPPVEHARLFVRDHKDEAELPLAPDSFGKGAIPDYQVVGGQRRPGQYVDRYDAEIHAFDAEVGRLMDGLRARGVLDDALVVLTADHGESLGEKDSWFCHGETLQRELVRVPLIVKPPKALGTSTLAGRVGQHETRVTSYLDVWPTVIESLGLREVPNRGMSLFSADWPSDRVVAQSLGPVHLPRRWLTITDGRWRVFLPGPDSAQLYDMRSDPSEEHDVAAIHPDIVFDLQRRYEASQASFAAPEIEGMERKLDDAGLRALGDIGYTQGRDEDR